MTSVILTAAQRLYDAGLNPAPIKVASKCCFTGWRLQETARLHRPQLPDVFDAGVNVGVAVLCGRTSHNLFVIDCDTMLAFEWVGGQLAERGITTWVRSSPRGGQFWFCSSEGTVENVTDREGYQVWGHDQIAVAPPSIHATTGEVIEWIVQPDSRPTMIDIRALDFLGLTLHRAKKIKVEKGQLPPVADRILVQRDYSGYASVSHAESAACWSLMGAGATDEEIKAVFRRWSPPHYRKKGPEDWVRSLLVPARKSFGAASESQSSQVARLALLIREAVESLPWPGASGASSRAVLVAMTERMRLDNSKVFRASHREIALIAGVTPLTVGRALKRLTAGENRWLIPIASDKNTAAFRWSFDDRVYDCFTNVRENAKDRTVSNTVASCYARAEHSVLLTEKAGHDVWHREALGKSALAVYDCLRSLPSGESSTIKEIASVTGKVASTVGSALGRLEEVGLVTGDDGAWSVSIDADYANLNRVAHDFGTRGRGEAKREAYRIEREKYVTRLIIEAVMRPAPLTH